MVGKAVAAVVVLFVVPGITVSLSPAGAAGASTDTIGGLEASINSLESSVTSQAAQIHQLTAAYQQDVVRSDALRQQITTDRASLGGLRAKVDTREADLRSAAIRAYTDGAAPGKPSEAARTNPAVGDEYLSVATGDVSDTVDQLRLDQRQLELAEDTVHEEQQANQTALDAAAAARNQALAAAAQTQDQLDSLQSKLQQLQAQAAAAQAAAAQAAAARAAATAQQAIEARATTSQQGAPVGNGLVSTVDNELSAPAPSAPPTPAATVIAPAPTATTTTTTTSPTPQAQAPEAGPAGGATSAEFAELRQCESSDNYQENTGNGYYGAYQFSQATWSGLGFPGRPDLEPPAMQDQAAEELQAADGWGQWPACSAALGL